MTKLKLDGKEIKVAANGSNGSVDLSEYVKADTFNDKFNQVNDGVLYLMDEMNKKANSEEMVKLIDLKANNDALIKAQEYLQSQITFNYNLMIENDEKMDGKIAEALKNIENTSTYLSMNMQANIDSMTLTVQRQMDEAKKTIQELEQRVNDALNNLKE